MRLPVCPICQKEMTPVEFRYPDGDYWYGWHCECTARTRMNELFGQVMIYESCGAWEVESCSADADGYKQMVYVGANTTPAPERKN